MKLLVLVVSLTMGMWPCGPFENKYFHSLTNLFNLYTNDIKHKTHTIPLMLIFASSLVICFQKPNINLAKYQSC